MITICVIHDWIGKWFLGAKQNIKGPNQCSQSELMLHMPEKERKKN